MISLQRLTRLMEGKLKSWDDCRCGRCVGRARFHRSGTIVQQTDLTPGVQHFLLPENASESTIINLINQAIDSASWTDVSTGRTYKANRALYSSGDNANAGFFLFLSFVDAGDCDC